MRKLDVILVMLFACATSGCTLLGVAASAVPQRVTAKYSGLAGHSVAIMVWADQAVLIDWGTIQLDLAKGLQQRLLEVDAKEVKGATWPILPASIVRYQREHREIDAMPITEVAPRFKVSRLIYIEVRQFRSRSSSAIDLYRGLATVDVKVIEIADGRATEVFSETSISASFPESAPPEGVLAGSDLQIYNGTINALADELARVFVTHEAER